MTLRARFNMTQSQMPVVEAKSPGFMKKDWYTFMTNLYTSVTDGMPQPEEAAVVTASPFTYEAVIRGQAHVSGGTVSAIEFSRDGTTWYSTGTTSGFVQMDARDLLRITYTVLPTLKYFPM
jgi:hypothetical protein